uniref:Uncharacterized protein n=1 Tax=Leersia perrieri TaxID=77586 RepID=A0A0D9XE99_9ORYZ
MWQDSLTIGQQCRPISQPPRGTAVDAARPARSPPGPIEKSAESPQPTEQINGRTNPIQRNAQETVSGGVPRWVGEQEGELTGSRRTGLVSSATGRKGRFFFLLMGNPGPEDGVLPTLLVAVVEEEGAEPEVEKKAADAGEGLAKAWALSLPADMATVAR